ncbi:glycosyltransferase [Mycolicibacterium sp. S2-37]|uniref:glycosyltransferase family 2 protein n=1 Tax=Mycolicibacterium sp. S2-37 TaxID=2810297 RepID=UPI001A9462BE|nr:glycosyltransferase [Mycolicibacterium sp. S2-37]MBO0676797.1 glycosyltransferase [Mycolicibacterium sp. S2-37]
MRISLLLPTRQRPAQLSRLVLSILETANDPSRIELVTYVDDDDPTYDALKLELDWVRVGGPRLIDGLVNLSVMWNACYEKSSGDIVMHCGDDIIFRTPGWDDVVRSAFNAAPDRIIFAYGRDGIQGDDFGTHGFIHRKWVEAVGFFVPPYFVSDFNDTFLNDVAKTIGRHQLLPIFTEHMHYTAGKASIDRNTAERLDRHTECRPDLLYQSPKIQQEIADAAARLRGVMSQ